MIKRLIAAVFVLLAADVATLAQTSPNLITGQVLTAAQWNALFIAKQDTLGYIPLNTAGGVMTGRLVTAAPGATLASFNLPQGNDPGSPANGDMWMKSTGLFIRVNGVTVGPLTGAAGSSFSATSPLAVTFPAGVVNYAFNFSVANTWLAQQTGQGLTTTQPGWYVQINGDTVPRIHLGTSTTDVPTLSFGSGSATRDAFIQRVGAGSFRFGGPDAAAPVAQIFSVQNVLTGTSNTAGANLTISGSQSTGTGLGGSIIFQTSPAGGSGSTPNALSNAMTILGSGATAIKSPATQALAVGLNGATNPALQVDASTASQVAGLSVKGAVTGGTVALAAIDSGANANISLNAKGSGAITIGGVSTGSISLTAAGGSATTVNIGTAGTSSGTLGIAGGSSGTVSLIGQSAASGTLTLPNGADTLVGRATTDTLTNKTLTSPVINTTFTATGLVKFADIATAALATTSQWRSNAASLMMQTDQVWASGAVVTLTDASTVTPDFSTGFNFTWILGATGRTLASPTNVKVGQTGTIQIIEDATGSRTITTYGSTWKFSGGIKPVLTSTANAVDLFAYFCYATTACVITATLNLQ